MTTCTCCHNDHDDVHAYACQHCQAQVRRWLREIPELAAAIEASLDGRPKISLGTPSSREGGHSKHGGKDRPMPGGDALAMLGPGSDGEFAPGDPVPVLWALNQWVRDWTETLEGGWEAGGSILAASEGEQVLAATPGGYNAVIRPQGTLVSVCTWLAGHNAWAARHHLAYDDFHRELRALHRQLERASRTQDEPETGGAPCIDCGVLLVRYWLAKHGLDDRWTCPRCKRRYDQADYWLAVRQANEATREVQA